MKLPHPLRFTPDLEIAMRDGVTLRADIYEPQDDIARPVVLARTPYDKQLADPPRPWMRFASAGYRVVVQDCRGRNASEGEFVPFRDEMADGYDTVEWVASQPWCNGRVGMYGTSYLGVTQWMAAAAAPPHLTTIVPAFTGADYHDGWIYHSGALMLSFAIGWTLPFALGELERSEVPAAQRPAIAARLRAMLDDIPATVAHRPLADVPALSDHELGTYYFEWLAHPEDDEMWRRWSVPEYHPQITIPVLSFGGWYDMFLRGTIQNYRGLRENGGSDRAREGQRLVIGPWAHGKPLYGQNPDPDISFGLGATSLGVEELSLRWFEHWLWERENGVLEETDGVTYFVLGPNHWRGASDWPPPEATSRELFLHSLGAANSLSGDGRLTVSAPVSTEPEDAFVFDPRRPVPTRGGAAYGNGGARDQRSVERRADVLVYSTDPLEAPLEIAGPVQVCLWAASTAPDTDFTAKLVDVSPDGMAMNLTDGIARASARPGGAAAPEQPSEYLIDLDSTAAVIAPGHRVRLEVSSSNFPRFDAHPNVVGPIADTPIGRPALQTVFHSLGRPSALRLSVLDHSKN